MYGRKAKFLIFYWLRLQEKQIYLSDLQNRHHNAAVGYFITRLKAKTVLKQSWTHICISIRQLNIKIYVVQFVPENHATQSGVQIKLVVAF